MLLRFAILSLFFCVLPLYGQAAEPICPGLAVRDGGKLGFTDSEKRLLCGDAKARDWQNVPKSQAVFALKNFLQDRGYFYPRIQTEGGQTVVSPGEPTRVTDVRLTGAPPEMVFSASDYAGELLTPALLRTLSQSLPARLGPFGYACPRVETQGDPSNGVVSVRIQAGEKQKLIEVKEETVPGLLPGTLRRYDAFVLGERFDADLLPLTASRAVSDGIVASMYFNTKCTPEGVIAEQKIIAGKPRQVTLGLGLNTDRGLILRGSWRHARLGERGSEFFAALSATYKGRDFNSQEARVDAEWYVLSQPSRFHLRPLFSARHESDNRRDVIKGLVQVVPAVTWDTQAVGGMVSLGPALTGEYTLRGVGRTQSYFLALAAETRITSHDYEWQRANPRSGFELTSSFSASSKGIFADFSSQLFSLRYTHLKGYPFQGRRFLVMGFRFGFATTLFQGLDGGLAALTPGLRHYLGGSSNVRGLGFQELPDDTGGLSSLFGGLEARGGGILPFDLQPLLLVDMGSISRASMDIAGPWYFSPGAGLRFPSPIGVFRATLARAYALSTPSTGREHWQFHLTYGEEF